MTFDFAYDRFDIVDIIRLTQESSACFNNSTAFSGDIIENMLSLPPNNAIISILTISRSDLTKSILPSVSYKNGIH